MEDKREIGTKAGAASLVIAIAVLSTFSIMTASAQGDPGAGCPSVTEFYGTIHGGVYFEQQGYASFREMTKTFENVPSGIKLARVYTGFWQGSPGKGGYFNITIQNANGDSYTTDTYKACDPCANASGCAPYPCERCDALNASINSPWNDNLDKVNMHDYIVGCGVQFISFNATPYISPGTNTITVRGEPCLNCTRGGWDGRIYVIALLVVYENSSMPNMTYWVNEGALYLEEGSACVAGGDHHYASNYFNGTHVSGCTRVKLWTMGWPHVINATEPPAYTKLNGHNIGYPDVTESYGGGDSEVLLRWNNISCSYLNTSSNLLEYYDDEPYYERAFVETLIALGHVGPDLQVTGIGFPAMMRPNKAYKITAKIGNFGDNTTGRGFNVSLRVWNSSGTYYNQKLQVSALNANAFTTVNFTNVNLPAGCYNFTVTADCDNNVSEGDKSNNEKNECYQVGYVIVVNGNSDFEELNASNPNASAPLPSGCFVNKSGTYYIQNLNITNCGGDGIHIKNTNVPFVITNCTIHDCGKPECCNKPGRGILFEDVMNGEVTNCEVYGNTLKGIRMTNSSHIIIDNNNVHDNLKYGIDIYPGRMPYPDCEYVTASNNTLVRNLYGIELLGYNCTLRDNVILNTTAYGGGESGWGIYVAGAHNKIYNNTIKYSHSYGMYVDYDRNCLPTYENCIFGNTFVDNCVNISHTSQAYDSSSTHGAYNYWNSTVELGYYNSTGSPFDNYIGNYWGECTDANNDGICDTSYGIDGGTMKDYAPLVQPWMNYPRIKCGDVDASDGSVPIKYLDVRKLNKRYHYPSYALASEWAGDVDCSGSIKYLDVRKLNKRYHYPSYALHCCTGCC